MASTEVVKPAEDVAAEGTGTRRRLDAMISQATQIPVGTGKNVNINMSHSIQLNCIDVSMTRRAVLVQVKEATNQTSVKSILWSQNGPCGLTTQMASKSHLSRSGVRH